MVGTSGEMMLTPFGALVAGFLAGTVSTLGYKFFTVQMPLRPRVDGGSRGSSLLQQARGGRGSRNSRLVSCPSARP